MSLNLKNVEAERLVRELAARTGESITDAVTESVRERLARLDADDARAADDRLGQLERISQDAAARWRLRYGATDHGDLLYGERGLPG
ncbi:MAG TPA: type II toxin-antitoxin system VapB family antitoxin [Acidimicrobiales bacterium]|nr:type II toxin-antitoxin system VapB family antitoxin [Acidimicrobiales bacterium]